jgi:hypothetical protein
MILSWFYTSASAKPALTYDSIILIAIDDVEAIFLVLVASRSRMITGARAATEPVTRYCRYLWGLISVGNYDAL